MIVTAKAKLIRFTENPESTIALASKLCYSSLGMDELIERIDGGDNAKFIKMLKTMNHLSPFEHASFTFSVEGVSRAFLAQVTRHRIASFSVRSQRYVGESDFNYIVPPAIADLGDSAKEEFVEQMRTVSQWYNAWQERLGGGERANEDARFVLPNACETKMILTMNARELMHFFSLRCCNRAQWEIRDVAWQMLSQVLEVAPDVFEGCGPTCLTGACSEGKKSCGKAALVRERYERLKECAKGE
ncbi:MAG: FAD-dependent thymidylate synthase [Clostridia bacterium]|nr:FAD-dependent thymidylate synthase [Clostridia bacterium]